jgi:hypothetical protein
VEEHENGKNRKKLSENIYTGSNGSRGSPWVGKVLVRRCGPVRKNR